MVSTYYFNQLGYLPSWQTLLLWNLDVSTRMATWLGRPDYVATFSLTTSLPPLPRTTRAEIQERQRKQLNNLVLWVSLTGVLIILNSLSIIMALLFMHRPTLCTPLSWAVFTFTYNSTRLGISYTQVRAVRRSSDPTTYTTLCTLLAACWRRTGLSR